MPEQCEWAKAGPEAAATTPTRGSTGLWQPGAIARRAAGAPSRKCSPAEVEDVEEGGSPVPPAPPVVGATRAAIRRSMSASCSGEKWATSRTPSAAERGPVRWTS